MKNLQDAVSLNEYRHFLRAVEDLRRESTAKNESSGRTAPKPSQYDTATRTERMEKEIRDLEQESYYKDTSSKAQSKKDRENQIKHREVLIDGISLYASSFVVAIRFHS